MICFFITTLKIKKSVDNMKIILFNINDLNCCHFVLGLILGIVVYFVPSQNMPRKPITYDFKLNANSEGKSNKI